MSDIKERAPHRWQCLVCEQPKPLEGSIRPGCGGAICRECTPIYLEAREAEQADALCEVLGVSEGVIATAHQSLARAQDALTDMIAHAKAAREQADRIASTRALAVAKRNVQLQID